MIRAFWILDKLSAPQRGVLTDRMAVRIRYDLDLNLHELISKFYLRMHSNSFSKPMNWKTGLRKLCELSGTMAGTHLG
jgi:hypothetical protein